jgi:hypothetical protein
MDWMSRHQRVRRFGLLVAALAAFALGSTALANGVPSVTSLPLVKTANPVVGVKVGAYRGTWTDAPTSYSVQWVRCDADGVSNCTDITAYNSSSGTYTPTIADAGHTLRVRVIATNADGDSLPALSGPSGIVS